MFDIIIITGDVYVDHPAFGTAIIKRVLESHGYSVGVIAQPDWETDKDFSKLGQPKLFFGITAGNIDSMLAHYTANKKLRHSDAYSPQGQHGLRPNRATVVYANKIRQIYKKEVPIVLGGIEASLRRLAHYDYWTDKIRKSVLFDSKADLLVYGMAEKSIVEVADALKSGVAIKDVISVKGTCYISSKVPENSIVVPSFQQVSDSKDKFIDAQLLIESTDKEVLVQGCMDRFLVQNPPQHPLATQELDAIYDLPYTRTGDVPALETVKFSITSHRGCYGGCSFCSIGLHQGKTIQSRSETSIIKEVKRIADMPKFKGHITDVGGPTANMYGSVCAQQGCDTKNCLKNGRVCKNLKLNHKKYLRLLRKIRELPEVKHVSISSGIRHDLVLHENDMEFIEQLCKYYVSGRIKLAPEHFGTHVLKLMNKPAFKLFQEFVLKYRNINRRLGKKQFVEPYLISSHPGSTMKDMRILKQEMQKLGFSPKQVQDFIPNPMTMATCIYYTEMEPSAREKVYVAREARDKLEQRGVF